MKNASRCPGLRNIGPTRVEHREIKITFPFHARKHLGRSERLKAIDGIENATDDLVSFIYKPVAFEPGRDNGIVLEPYRAKLVQVWVICRILAGKRTNSPATPHIFLQQPLGRAFCFVLVGNAAPKTLASIGGN